MKDAVDKCEEVGFIFEHFTMNEWIFSNSAAQRLFVELSEEDRARFNFDVSRIEWKSYVTNNAYGIRRFVLKEEAELPSAGYNDVVSVSFFFKFTIFS